MSTAVTVKVNDADFRAGIASLRGKFPRAIRRAVYRSGVAARTEMSKNIRTDTGIAAAKIKDAMTLTQPSDNAILLTISGKRLPLIEFKARGPEPSRGRGRGVSYSLPGGRGRAPHAFIETMPSGHRGVFERWPGRAKTVRTARGRSGLPIRELHGPSLVKVFEKYLPIAADRGREALETNLRSELSYALSR